MSKSMMHRAFGPGELIQEPFLKHHFKEIGQKVRIFCSARIDHPDRVTIGSHTQIDEGVFLFAGEGICIGHHVHFAFGSSISGGGKCLVGHHVGIGAGVRLITGTENIEQGLTNPTSPETMRHALRSSVEIQNHAIVFTNTIVFPGVRIGEGAIVSAGSHVHRDLKPWTVYAGCPLVAVKTRDPERVVTGAKSNITKA
jgi:acetyltransferase-like isoleucine patch superfamily enzyme